MVRRATGDDDVAAMAALADLCEAYWFPIYAYIRRKGQSPHDAEDLTQGFFAWLLEKGALSKADADRGRLRTFLLTCARRFVSDEHDRAMAQKRNAAVLTNFDFAEAEECYVSEASHDLSPDRLFQRRWALTILERALTLLGNEFSAQGKKELFTALRPFLGFGPEPEKRYEEIAPALDMPLGTVKNHVFRLRQRWREIIFEEVAMTLDNATPEEIKAELAELISWV
jgi:RNA polymerase sigma-70 factor (ECF subfamily)